MKTLQQKAPGWSSENLFTQKDADNVLRFHNSLPGYQMTPLHSLREAAAKHRVKSVLVKDESARFGLNAFKGTGGSYAVFRILCDRFGMDHRTATYDDFRNERIQKLCRNITFVTATDGNHGKGVAWASRLFGCRSHVFMPAGSVEVRRQAIENAGASTVQILPLNYDRTVAHANRLAGENGWILIQDTAWEGYEEIPRWIVEGYLTLPSEVCEQADGCIPTHVFLQAGVGAMAGGVAGYLLNRYRDCPPTITVVEPETVSCVYLSAETGDGKPHSIDGDPVTIMAGLNCGTPCSITWPVLRDGASFFCACPDDITRQGMHAYAHPSGSDPVIVSGESGAVTYGLLLHILEREELRTLWGIDTSSVILLINTEGDTDPDAYVRIINSF